MEFTDGNVTMTVEPKKLKGLYEINVVSHDDDRGFMRRLFDTELLKKAGLKMDIVQESYSYVKKKNTVKGFHVALPPHLEGKTVSALKGKVMWVAIDLRKGSKTFGQYEKIILSGEKNNSLFAERGFAHGSITLTDDVSLLLRADNFFHQATGIVWNDPELKIDWGVKRSDIIIRERDEHYPTFKEFREKYGGT